MPRDQVGSEGNGAVLTILTIEDIHDYVDGAALDEVRQAIEALSDDDPRVERWVAAYRRQIAAMER